MPGSQASSGGRGSILPDTLFPISLKSNFWSLNQGLEEEECQGARPLWPSPAGAEGPRESHLRLVFNS